MPERCSAIAKSGSRCTRAPLTGSAYCLMHDPAAADARREAARKGGHARSNQARARKQIPEALTDEELLGWLSLTFKRVIAEQTEPRIATAAAAVAGTILKAKAALEVEERLSALEEAAGIDRGGRAA